MTYKIIKTEEDYQAALSRIDELMDAEPGTPEGDVVRTWLSPQGLRPP